MSDKLMKLWKENKLEPGLYYIDNKKYGEKIDRYIEQGIFVESPDKDIKEILCRVPDWKQVCQMEQENEDLMVANECLKGIKYQYKKLKEKLDISIDALQDIRVNAVRDWDEYDCMKCANKALLEVSKVDE